MVAGGVRRFPTLTFAGCEIGGWLDWLPSLGAAAASVNGGGGSSKLGSVGAAGRRTFNGADNGSNAVPIGAARVARFADGFCTPT